MIIGSSNPTPGHVSRQNWTQKYTCTPVFTAALFTTAKKWKQPKCPSIDEWIKMLCISTMEYHSAKKKEQNNAICSNIDANRDHHTMWSKPEREGQIPCDITYMWNLQHNTNEYISETEADSQTQRTDLGLPRGKRVGRDGLEIWG